MRNEVANYVHHPTPTPSAQLSPSHLVRQRITLPSVSTPRLYIADENRRQLRHMPIVREPMTIKHRGEACASMRRAISHDRDPWVTTADVIPRAALHHPQSTHTQSILTQHSLKNNNIINNLAFITRPHQRKNFPLGKFAL